MEERIKKFMEYKGITSSELADSIGVQRSNVTHVLKARNKPSFQFIEKMLQIYPELNAKWLMLGTGNMVDVPLKTKTLFDQLIEPESLLEQKPEKSAEKQLNQSIKPVEDIKPQETIKTTERQIPPVIEKPFVNNELQNHIFSSEKPIERLIIFYNDQTFKVYNPSR
ncbi:MAG: helix-turn-helix transcriptional regulator [Bacteroidia bacterium]|jgi:transcriptional regulator with XRE-family HTH domain